jgi:membrane associated rhomboid family serine protease
VRRPPPIQDWLKYPVTSGVATLAILVTVARLAGMDVSFLYTDTTTGKLQIWGLLTSAFPHADLIHLACNLYWLWVFGTLVEPVFGPTRTAAMLVLFAVGSEAAEFAIYDGGIGLSGVVYGLFALLWVLSKKDDRFGNAMDSQTISLFIVWFFICIYVTYAKIWPIGNVAHGMGAALGAMLGSCIIAQEAKRRIAETVLGFVIVAVLFLATLGRDFVNTDPRRFEKSGYQYLVEQKYNEAAKDLRTALKANPHDAGTWYNLALAYQGLEMDEEAADAMRHVCEENPASREFRPFLAHAKSFLAYRSHMAGKQLEAVQLYEQALALDNGSAANWYNLALARFQLGDIAPAKEAVDHAVSLDQTNTEYQQFKDFLEKTLVHQKQKTSQ